MKPVKPMKNQQQPLDPLFHPSRRKRRKERDPFSIQRDVRKVPKQTYGKVTPPKSH
jgi:hypothetical protein